VTVLILAAVAVVVWVLKEILGSLVSQQVKGSIPEYTTCKAIAAARILPQNLADEYLEDWLAELDALEDRPLTALRYARGLANAARLIAVLGGAPISYSRPHVLLHRASDIVGSAAAITFLWPIWTLLTLILQCGVWRSHTRRSIILRVPRYGKNGALFDCLQFAAPQRDSAKTAVGEFLAVTNLDQLPMLFTVLRGDMALIGPPPQMEPGCPLKVAPGLISWEHLAATSRVRLTMDEARVRDQSRSFRQDIRLLCEVVRFRFRF
jgi:lipopolysaccharide/colanic/teichoic acid biosynthesis glycosyltransferase